MRIAHCILEPRYSGAEILVLGLVRTQIAAGASVAIFSLRPSEVTFESELAALRALGCETFVPSESLVKLQRLKWIRRITRAFAPDVIFAHSLLPSVYGRLALFGIAGVSLVTVLHTDDDFRKWDARLFERCLWRRSAIIVGVSPTSLRNYRSRVTEKQKTRLIANGVDIQAIRSATTQRVETRRSVFRSDPDDIVFLQVGRISPQKQQHLSVQALAAFGQQRSLDSIRLVFAGVVEDREYFQEVMNIARSLGVESRIEFLGSRKDIPALLSAADACLMPSGWEAHSIAALEALASGIFCIFTRIDSFLSYERLEGVEILPREGSIAQLCAALDRSITNRSVSRRFARNLEEYSFQKCANEYMQVAESLSMSMAPDG